jgi:hypothetical protein
MLLVAPAVIFGLGVSLFTFVTVVIRLVGLVDAIGIVLVLVNIVIVVALLTVVCYNILCF